MTNDEIKSRLVAFRTASLGDNTPGNERVIQETMIDVFADFILDHKRQTELLEAIYADLEFRTNRDLGR